MNTLTFQPMYGWALIAVLLSAFVSSFFSLQAGVFGLLFLAVAWWVWDYQERGLLLFIVLAPLLPMLKITQTIGTATLLKDVIIWTLLLRVVVVPMLSKTLPYRRNVLLAPSIALALWVAVEMLRADALILGVLRARDIGLYMLLYLAVLYLPLSRKILKERLWWFAASFLIVLGLAVYQWFAAADSAVLRFDPVREIWIPRLSSIMAHPSIFGEYLVTAATLFAAGAYYLSGRARLVLGSLFVLTLPAIFLTYSRAVWIGLVVGGGTMVLVLLAQQFMARAGRTKLVRSAAVGLAVAALLLAGAMRFTPAGTFVRSAFDPTYGSNEERLEFLARLIAPLSDGEALVGRGLGDVLEQNFREVDVEIYDIASGASRTVQLTKNRTLVDNQYLKTFVEMGLAGLLIYSWLFWRFGAAAWKLVTGHQSRVTSHERRGADAPALAARVIGLWGVGFLAAFAVQGFFIDIWDIFPTNAAFWIVAAMVSAVSIPLASLNSTER